MHIDDITGVKIYGVDINDECKAFSEEDDIEIFIGDQSNKTFMQNVVDKIGIYSCFLMFVCICVRFHGNQSNKTLDA